MALIVVPEDFIVGAMIQDREPFYFVDDFLDPAHEFLRVFTPRPLALARDLLAQSVGDGFRDAGAAPARQFAGKLLGFCVLDVQCHCITLHAPSFLPSSYNSSFFLTQSKLLSNRLVFIDTGRPPTPPGWPGRVG